MKTATDIEALNKIKGLASGMEEMAVRRRLPDRRGPRNPTRTAAEDHAMIECACAVSELRRSEDKGEGERVMPEISGKSEKRFLFKFEPDETTIITSCPGRLVVLAGRRMDVVDTPGNGPIKTISIFGVARSVEVELS